MAVGLLGCTEDPCGPGENLVEDVCRPEACALMGCTEDPCGPGETLDEDICRPEACGTGTWGNLQSGEDSLYVNAAAGEGGDGSQASPFGSIAAALDAAALGDIDRILLAAGTYPEAVFFGPAHDGVSLRGRCAELVTIDGGGADDNVGVELIGTPETAVELSGLRVASFGIGVRAMQGQLAIAGSTVTDSATLGLMVSGGETVVSLEEVLVEGARGEGEPPDGSVAGTGVWVANRGTLTATRATVARNRRHGLSATQESSVHLVDCVVRETVEASQSDGISVETLAHVELDGGEVTDNGGVGLSVLESGTAEAKGTLFARNRDMGVRVQGTAVPDLFHPTASAVLEDVIIRSTREAFAYAEDDALAGAVVFNGGLLTIRDSWIEDNENIGVVVSDPNSRLVLEDTTVRDGFPNSINGGSIGVFALAGGYAHVASQSVVEGFHHRGVAATGAGAHIRLEDSIVRRTLLPEGQDPPFNVAGVEASSGGWVEATDCRFEDSAGAGVLAGGGIIDLLRTDIVGSHRAGLLQGGPGTIVTFYDGDVRDTRPDPFERGGSGIFLQEGASLDARGCSVTNSWRAGITVRDSANLVVQDCTVSEVHRSPDRTVAVGLLIHDSTADADSLTISDPEGLGLLASDGAVVACADCVIEGASFAGAAAVDATLTLTRAIIAGVARDASEGAGVGVWVDSGWGDADLNLRNSEVEASSLAAVYLAGQGRYQIDDNHLEGGPGFEWSPGTWLHGDAVVATGGIGPWQEDDGLRLTNNRLVDSAGTALFLDGSSATLSGNTYSANAHDIIQQECSEDWSPLSPDSADVELCTGSYRRVLPLSFDLTPGVERIDGVEW